MYISRVMLDTRKRETVKAFANREMLHGALSRCFNGEYRKVLWRIDDRESNPALIAVSGEVPYLGGVQEQFGDARINPETKDYDRYVGSMRKGMELRFRASVNPVIRKNGTNIPLNLRQSEEHPFCARDWFVREIQEHGGIIVDAEDMSHETAYFRKSGTNIPIFIVTYEGILRVVDEDAFKGMLTNGIGREKAYGCGLITVLPV